MSPAATGGPQYWLGRKLILEQQLVQLGAATP